MSKKRSVSTMLCRACLDSEAWTNSLIDAYSSCTRNASDIEYVKNLKDYLSQLRTYRLRRWGITEFEASLENVRRVIIADIPEGKGNFGVNDE